MIYRHHQSSPNKTHLRICLALRHSSQQLPLLNPVSFHSTRCKLSLSKHRVVPTQCSIPHKLISSSQVPHSMAPTFTKITPSYRRQAWIKPSKTIPSKCLRSSGVHLLCNRTRPPHSSFLRVQTHLSHLQQAS